MSHSFIIKKARLTKYQIYFRPPCDHILHCKDCDVRFLINFTDSKLYGVLISIHSSGQNAASLCTKIRQNLEDFRLFAKEQMSADQLCELDSTISKLSNKSPPFRPLTIFSIDNSSGIGLASIILTYVFVILQFKVSDVSELGFIEDNV